MRIFLLLASFLFCSAMPLAAQEAIGTIDTENSASEDAAIADRLREILMELGNYGDVTVTVNEGIVTLRGTTTSAAEAAELNALVNRMDGVVAVKNRVVETSDIAARLNPAVDRFKARVAQLITFLPLAAISLTVFLLITVLGFWVASWRRPWERLAPNPFIAELYRQFVRLIFIVVGIVVALDILNATALLSTILGAAGIVGLALGFAVRDTVENYIASVMLSIRQPFSPNDSVEIDGVSGKVIKLTSRATVLLSFDGNHIRIPNATVFKSRMTNFSRNPERRFEFEIGVAANTDLAGVSELALQKIMSLPFILPHPGAAVRIDRIGDGAVFLIATGWIDQRETDLMLARGETLRVVKLAIEAAGVDVPDTTYRIALLNGFTAPPDSPPVPNAVEAAPIVHLPDVPRTADVTATSDDALTEMIEQERAQPETGDLLTPGAGKE